MQISPFNFPSHFQATTADDEDDEQEEDVKIETKRRWKYPLSEANAKEINLLEDSSKGNFSSPFRRITNAFLMRTASVTKNITSRHFEYVIDLFV